MKCTLTDDSLHDFASGRLSGRESAAVKKHCRSCPSCAEKLGQIQNYYASLKKIPPAQAPAGFNASVLLRLEKARRRSVVYRRSIYAAAAASIAGIMLTAALVIIRPSQPEPLVFKKPLSVSKTETAANDAQYEALTHATPMSKRSSPAAKTESSAAKKDAQYDALTQATPRAQESRPAAKKPASPAASIAFNEAEKTAPSGYDRKAEAAEDRKDAPVYDLALVMPAAEREETSSAKEMKRSKADVRSGASSSVPAEKISSDIQSIVEQRIVSHKGTILSRTIRNGMLSLRFEISSAGLDSLVASLSDLGDIQIRHLIPASEGKVTAEIQIIQK